MALMMKQEIAARLEKETGKQPVSPAECNNLIEYYVRELTEVKLKTVLAGVSDIDLGKAEKFDYAVALCAILYSDIWDKPVTINGTEYPTLCDAYVALSGKDAKPIKDLFKVQEKRARASKVTTSVTNSLASTPAISGMTRSQPPKASQPEASFLRNLQEQLTKANLVEEEKEVVSSAGESSAAVSAQSDVEDWIERFVAEFSFDPRDNMDRVRSIFNRKALTALLGRTKACKNGDEAVAAVRAKVGM